jgi:hypothetical protein
MTCLICLICLIYSKYRVLKTETSESTPQQYSETFLLRSFTEQMEALKPKILDFFSRDLIFVYPIPYYNRFQMRLHLRVTSTTKLKFRNGGKT